MIDTRNHLLGLVAMLALSCGSRESQSESQEPRPVQSETEPETSGGAGTAQPLDEEPALTAGADPESWDWPAELDYDECQRRIELVRAPIDATIEGQPECNSDDECVEIAVTTATTQACPVPIHVSSQQTLAAQSQAFLALLQRLQQHGCSLPRSARCRAPAEAVCQQGNCVEAP